MKEEIDNKIFTFDNFLNLSECQTFMGQINAKQNTVCFTNVANFKNDKYIDLQLATYFFDKIKKQCTIPIIRPNNLIMTGKYIPNQQFSIHTDTGLYFNRNKHEKSRYTLLIYLNDDYENGETIFYTDDFKLLATITPKRGMALVFDIDLWHKGNIVLKNDKYWIGCELIGKFN